MPDNDDIIEEAVVRVSPVLDGFGRPLNRKIERELRRRRGVDPKVHVGVDFDKRDLDKSFAQLGRRINMLAAAENTKFRQVRTNTERFHRDHIRAVAAAKERELSLVRSVNDRITRDHVRAYAMQATMARQAAAEQERIARASAAEQEKVNRQVLARRAATQKAFKSAVTAPKIIDLGGQGIKPTRLLLGVVAALTPAMFAMGTSALQASTSVAALGAAGIGAATGLTAVLGAFGNVAEALKLAKSAAKTEAGADVKGRALANARRLAVAQRRAADANQRLADGQRNLARAARDLARARREADADSPVGSDSPPTRRLQDREEAVAKAKRGVSRAAQDYAHAQQLANHNMTKGSAASRELEKKLAELTPAARELFELLREGGTGSTAWAAFQKRMEVVTLPGFTQFLRDVGVDGKDANSTLAIIADSAENMGDIFSDTFERLGKVSKQKWFRSDLRKITEENDKAFRNFGDTAVILIKPLMTIIRAASPLLTKFSVWLKDSAIRFAYWIDEVDRSGSLAKWFEDAGTELGKWGGITRDLFRTLVGLFSSSDDAGRGLVDRVKDLTGALADWANSEKGQRQLTAFFDAFQKFDYAAAATFIGQLTTMLTTWGLIKFVANHPIPMLISAIGLINPEATKWIVDNLAKGISTVFQWARDNPEAAVALTALLVAAKGLGKGGMLQLLMPGDGAIKTFMGKLLGTKTGVMHVTAGVVNIAGAGGIVPGGKGGKPGALPVVVSGSGAEAAGKTAGQKFKAGLLAGGGGLFKIVAGLLVADLVFNVLTQKDLATETQKLIDEATGRNELTMLEELARLRGLAPGRDAPSGGGSYNPRPYTPWDPSPVVKPPGYTPKSFNVPSPGGALVGIRGERIGAEKRAFDDLTKAIADNRLAVLKNNGASADANSTLQNYITTRRAAVLAAVAYTAETKGAGAAEEELARQNNTSRQALFDTLVQMGWNREEARKYAEKIYGIPTVRETAITAETTTAKTKLDDVIAQIAELEGIKKTTVTVEGQVKVQAELDRLLVKQMALTVGIGVQEAGKILAARNSSATKKATGGYIRGPGGPTGDKIPAWLSDREFVEPAHVVDHYGVDGMEAIRQKKVPKWALEPAMYAQGGPASWPFPVDVSKTKIPTPGGFGGIPYTGAGFGPWPSSPGAQRGDSGVWRRIIGMIQASGIKGGRPSSTYRHGDPRWHGSGRAVDWAGYNQDALATYLAGQRPLELIHRTGRRDYAYTRGRNAGSFNAGLMNAHRNHIHIAMADGGRVRARLYDGGGILPPGPTLAVNDTGRNEYVSTTPGGDATTRLDRRDLALLAAYINRGVSGQPIAMDGRRVAEVVRAYDHIPRGL